MSTHAARWHTGRFFLVQSERAVVGSDAPAPFDTPSIVDVDSDSGAAFAQPSRTTASTPSPHLPTEEMP